MFVDWYEGGLVKSQIGFKMRAMGTGTLPVDWYSSTLSGDGKLVFWDEGAEEKVSLALKILRPRGNERILDLACTTGQRALELSRRGFGVVGTDLDEGQMEVGACEAEDEDLYPYFLGTDVRELRFMREFDLVLSLGGGAFGYFDGERDNHRIFQLISQSLRVDGRLLMQMPNVVYVEAHLPGRTWLETEHATLLVEQDWDPEGRRIVGSVMTLVESDTFRGFDPEPFARRIYSVEELAEAFESVGMELVDVYDDSGKRCAPTEQHQEIFVEARF